MASNLMGPGNRVSGSNDWARAQRESNDRMREANDSAHPNRLTLDEVNARQR